MMPGLVNSLYPVNSINVSIHSYLISVPPQLGLNQLIVLNYVTLKFQENQLLFDFLLNPVTDYF